MTNRVLVKKTDWNPGLYSVVVDGMVMKTLMGLSNANAAADWYLHQIRIGLDPLKHNQ